MADPAVPFYMASYDATIPIPLIPSYWAYIWFDTMAPSQFSGFSLDQVETIASRDNIGIHSGTTSVPFALPVISAPQALAHNLLRHCESTDTPT